MSFIPLFKHPEVHCAQIFCGENPTQTCLQNFKSEICNCCEKDERESKHKICLNICHPDVLTNIGSTNIGSTKESYDNVNLQPGWLEDFRRPGSRVLFNPDPDPRLNWILYSLLVILIVVLIVTVIIYRRLFRVV
jgi:hypothetical protein